MEEVEVWRPVVGLEGRYEVSSNGRIWSLLTGRIKSHYINRNGYIAYNLATLDGKRTKMAHRLFYEAFVAPILPGYEINHKDGNKLNNSVENLEAVSHQENIDHSILMGMNPQKKPVIMVDQASGRRITFGSINRAALTLGLCPRHITAARGKAGKSVKGWKVEIPEAKTPSERDV